MSTVIQVQATPNPNARKFVLPRPCFAAAQNFASAEAATAQPLAARLFGLAGVYNVFWAQDFVTVNKRPDVAWEPLQSQAQTLLAEYFSENVDVLTTVDT